MNKKLVAFNWKMNPDSLAKAKNLFVSVLNFKSLKNLDIVVFPPSVYLSSLGSINKTGVKLGAQDVFWESASWRTKTGGAYTGEISPKILKDSGVKYVIIGHSERRQILGETDGMINKKVLAALKVGLKVILCVGEDLSVYKKGVKVTKNYIRNQIEKDLSGLTKSYKLKANSLLIAYEPIWAIGSGKNDTPKDAAEMISFIRDILNSKFQILNSKILYGGSVNGRNILDYMTQPEIDGVLIGGASVDKKELLKLSNALRS